MDEVYWEKNNYRIPTMDEILFYTVYVYYSTYKITLWSNFYYSHFIDREMRLTDQGKLNPLLKDI